MGTPQATDFYAEYKPTLWHRVRCWRRWPWQPKQVPFEERSYDSPWVTRVSQNGLCIGWHRDQTIPDGFGLHVDRWSCLAGLFSGDLHYEFLIRPGQRRTPEETLVGPLD